MSLCDITLAWGDGEHRFALPLAQLEELQEKCDAGPLVVFGRLTAGTWLTGDVYQTLRLSLIGGGMAPAAALALCRRYVLERPWLESVPVAATVLGVAVNGRPQEPLGDSLGKPKAVRRRAPRTARTAGSPSRTSTASAP